MITLIDKESFPIILNCSPLICHCC